MFSLISGTFEVKILLPEFLSQVVVDIGWLANICALEDPRVVQLIGELLVDRLLWLTVEADINKLSVSFDFCQLEKHFAHDFLLVDGKVETIGTVGSERVK